MDIHEDLFRELVEFSPDLISVVDELGIVVYVNRAYEEGLGYARSSLLGKHFAEVIHLTEESLKLCVDMFPLVLSGMKADMFLVEVRHKLGNLHTFEVKYNVVQKGPYIQIVLRDVTEQQRLRKSKAILMEKNKLLVKTLDYTGVGITITDPSQRDNPIIYANRAFESLTGYDRSEIIGKNCRFLQGPLTNRETVSSIKKGLLNQEEVKVELINYKKDHTTFWNELTINPVFSTDGTVTNYIGIQRDVTDRKSLEIELIRDLNLSRKLQQYLLSEPINDTEIKFHGLYQPSKELGGDFYKWRKLKENVYGLILIDVMGHGIAASLLTMSLNAEISSLWKRDIYDPKVVVNKLNQHMFEIFSGQKESRLHRSFFTCIYMTIDTKSKHIEYVNAGHPSFFLKGEEGEVEGISTDIPVGMLYKKSFESKKIRYKSQTHLYLYTDGLLDYYQINMSKMSKLLTVQTLQQLTEDVHLSEANDDVCFIHVQIQ